MSHKLISHSADLKHLRDEGYDIEIKSGYLLVKTVPYVNSTKEIKFGTLVSKLTLANDVTTTPGDHVAYFVGEYPCRQDGQPIAQIANQSAKAQLDRDLVVDHTFSAKPSDRYPDYYFKMTTYFAIISGPAQAIDPSVTAKTFRVIEATEEESVFRYLDTASSRAEINAATRKLALVGKLAIVGLGGTGSYVLDLVAKTPAKEIHLFDGDKFLQHNAFRSPGAPSGDELEEQLYKTTYFERLYSKMRRGVVDHPIYIDASNVDQLREMNFVFLCGGREKKLVVQKLEEFTIPFIDVGMGIYMTDDSLGGILRITTSTPEQRNHVWANKRIPFSDGDANDEYDRNIQIADLNALNAALAVIKWKKLFGFYLDQDHEHYSAYTIGGNSLLNEDKS